MPPSDNAKPPIQTTHCVPKRFSRSERSGPLDAGGGGVGGWGGGGGGGGGWWWGGRGWFAESCLRARLAVGGGQLLRCFCFVRRLFRRRGFFRRRRFGCRRRLDRRFGRRRRSVRRLIERRTTDDVGCG